MAKDELSLPFSIHTAISLHVVLVASAPAAVRVNLERRILREKLSILNDTKV